MQVKDSNDRLKVTPKCGVGAKAQAPDVSKLGPHPASVRVILCVEVTLKIMLEREG